MISFQELVQVQGVDPVQPQDPGLTPATKRLFDDATVVLFVGLGLGLIMALMFWFFVKKDQRRRSRKTIQSKSHRSAGSVSGPDSESDEGSSRKRRRRRKKSHRKSNPTLAETGGLPPARAEDSPEIECH